MNAPTTSPDRTNAERLAAASLAAGAVKDGMVIGFGTGRAAEAALTILARRVYEGLKVSGIPTSIATEAHARALGLPLTDLSAHPSLDLTIDGADEVDPARNLIKGGGAALFREKVLAAASDRLIIVVDSTKLVTRLGSTRGIPVEVLPFATGACIRQIAEMGGEAIVRTKNESPVVTDNGNWVLDVTFDAEAMANPRALDTAMRAIPGVIITGLFWSFDATVVVGSQGGTEVLGPPL
jgi:ribose 5-phosphate isomerase A